MSLFLAFASHAFPYYTLLFDLMYSLTFALLPVLLLVWLLRHSVHAKLLPPSPPTTMTTTLASSEKVRATRGYGIQCNLGKSEFAGCDIDTVYYTSGGKSWHKDSNCYHLKAANYPVCHRVRCRTCG
jgi:hypothetical protein